MKLDELHVDEFRARMVGDRMAVAGALPTVAGDFERAPDAARREHDRLRCENLEPPALAVVSQHARDARAVLEQRDNRVLHVNVDALVNAVVLQRADHLQPGAVADVREPRIFVAAEIALENAPVRRAVEDRAPRFEFAHAVGGLACVQFGHAPVVDVLPAAHRVGEMDAPAIALIDIGERRSDAALGHDRVRLAEQGFANHADGDAGGGGFDGCAQAGAAGADDEDVVGVDRVVGHGALEREALKR